MADDKILFVDDEKNLLDGIRRDIGDHYCIITALGGIEGMEKIKTTGPFAVVISDMHMPDVNGIRFLEMVQEYSPESIRVMLTGNTDINVAINAVNRGNIFRFITKPCPTEILEKVIDSSIQQYHLIRAERELLENTLKGGIKVLIDILALTNPLAFGRAQRIKHFARQLAKHLNVSDIWRIEVAAMLSQIGCVTIPPDILEKAYKNLELSHVEKVMWRDHPKTAQQLIAHIPRLETIAEMIAYQQKDFSAYEQNDDLVTLGASILRVAIDLDTLLSRGFSRERAFHELNENAKAYSPEVLSSIKKLDFTDSITKKKKIMVEKIRNLQIGMMLEDDVKSKKGTLLAKQGQMITSTMRSLFENYYQHKLIDDSISVSIYI